MLERFQHPTQVVVSGFATAVLVGTGLLLLPQASAGPGSTRVLDALFTATSAVCVTGLITVDTPGHWTTFGELVIMALIQIGGLGIMTLSTVFAILMSRRLGLRARMAAHTETKTFQAVDIRRVVRNVVLFSFACEGVVATILTVRFVWAYEEPFGRAAYLGLFHGVSSFNNAGFALWSDSLMGFAHDPLIMVTLCMAVITGGLGFPVIFELTRTWRRPRHWSMLTRVTLGTTAALLTVGTMLISVVEWNNPRTLGSMSAVDSLLNGFLASVMTRSGGFNTVDIGQVRPESLLTMDALMFIGGGSAGTAGGIKVTTFGLLAFVMWAEIRGHARVNVGHRRLAETTQRQAVTIALMGVGLVAVASFTMLALAGQSLDLVLFEAISSFGIVGLSTGITGDLPSSAQVLMVVLMFIGRTGPLTLATALALRERTRRYELPEERPIVG